MWAANLVAQTLKALPREGDGFAIVGFPVNWCTVAGHELASRVCSSAVVRATAGNDVQIKAAEASLQHYRSFEILELGPRGSSSVLMQLFD